jgi:YfiH family protein
LISLYSFDLAFSADNQGRPVFAAFPFMFDGAPLTGISCGVSSRFAGDMAYSGETSRRSALLKALGLDPLRVYSLNQVHSRVVLAVDRLCPPVLPADGMVTDDREITLSVTVADCLPVYLFDTETGVFGLVHSGWKGTGIALSALKLMAERWGSSPEAIAAVLGPCIDSCCYKVDGERAAAFEKEFGVIRKSGLIPRSSAPPGLIPMPAEQAPDIAFFKRVTRREDTPDGPAWYLDLKAANVRLLAGAGVRNISVCGGCTFTDERLGSFRREGEGYTRMAALCGRFKF